MKKVLVLLLVGLMLMSSTVMVFAEENDGSKVARGERTELSREEKEQKVLALFESYNPLALATFESLKAEHKSFHEMVRAEKEIIKATFVAEREALKASVENGELSQEEIRAIFQEYKTEREALKEEFATLRAAKQAEVEANKAELKQVREALRLALTSEEIDANLVASLLDQMVILLNNHLDIDYYYYDLLSGMRNN